MKSGKRRRRSRIIIRTLTITKSAYAPSVIGPAEEEEEE